MQCPFLPSAHLAVDRPHPLDREADLLGFRALECVTAVLWLLTLGFVASHTWDLAAVVANARAYEHSPRFRQAYVRLQSLLKETYVAAAFAGLIWLLFIFTLAFIGLCSVVRFSRWDERLTTRSVVGAATSRRRTAGDGGGGGQTTQRRPRHGAGGGSHGLK